MKTRKQFTSKMLRQLFLFMLISGVVLPSFSQEISVWQFRRVEQANMQEFIERETKYWSKVAESGT